MVWICVGNIRWEFDGSRCAEVSVVQFRHLTDKVQSQHSPFKCKIYHRKDVFLAAAEPIFGVAFFPRTFSVDFFHFTDPQTVIIFLFVGVWCSDCLDRHIIKASLAASPKHYRANTHIDNRIEPRISQN